MRSGAVRIGERQEGWPMWASPRCLLRVESLFRDER